MHGGPSQDKCRAVVSLHPVYRTSTAYSVQDTARQTGRHEPHIERVDGSYRRPDEVRVFAADNDKPEAECYLGMYDHSFSVNRSISSMLAAHVHP